MKKYRITHYDEDTECFEAKYLKSFPGASIGRGYLMSLHSHRNMSQLGTCAGFYHLKDREMVFGDRQPGHIGKYVDNTDASIYRDSFIPNKLFRFVRS